VDSRRFAAVLHLGGRTVKVVLVQFVYLGDRARRPLAAVHPRGDGVPAGLVAPRAVGDGSVNDRTIESCHFVCGLVDDLAVPLDAEVELVGVGVEVVDAEPAELHGPVKAVCYRAETAGGRDRSRDTESREEGTSFHAARLVPSAKKSCRVTAETSTSVLTEGY
jgi:hypothetical protein